MYLTGGRGGPITVLLGLFLFAILGLLYVLKWAAVGLIVLLIEIGRGIRWLYLRHQEKQEERSPEQPVYHNTFPE